MVLDFIKTLDVRQKKHSQSLLFIKKQLFMSVNLFNNGFQKLFEWKKNPSLFVSVEKLPKVILRNSD